MTTTKIRMTLNKTAVPAVPPWQLLRQMLQQIEVIMMGNHQTKEYVLVDTPEALGELEVPGEIWDQVLVHIIMEVGAGEAAITGLTEDLLDKWCTEIVPSNNNSSNNLTMLINSNNRDIIKIILKYITMKYIQIIIF